MLNAFSSFWKEIEWENWDRWEIKEKKLKKKN